jgi:hypothetical protein
MTDAFPLQWPDGWPRTDPNKRESDSRFHAYPVATHKR